ncbi:MAG: acyloxyacyl hydrolase [Hyphomicrobium aestuarii]|nr:acyloxyacyl hydrolase [Hyphomicrobium aestuarii]
MAFSNRAGLKVNGLLKPIGGSSATAAVMLAAMLAFTLPVKSEGLIHQLTVGALYHDMPDLWSGFQREPTSVDINVEAQLSPSMPTFFGGTLRPAIGANINTAGATSNIYADARITYDLPHRWFFATGLGLAIHDGNTDRRDPERKALGSRALFHIPIEAGLRIGTHNSVSVYFEHTSNGYTQTFNEGFDRFGLRAGTRY